MGTEDERSPLDPMGGPTPFDIISDAKGVLAEDDPRLRAEEALVGRGLPERRRAGVRGGAADVGERRAAPRTFEEHIKEATGQFPTVDGEELDPEAAQASPAARRAASGRSGEVGRASSGRIPRASAEPEAGGRGAAGGSGRPGRADATGPGARVARDAGGAGRGAAGATDPTALDGARRRAAGDGGPSAAGQRRSRAAAEAQAEARRRRRARRWLVARVVLGVAAAVLLVVAVAFLWFRWFSGDDAQDIQGVWFVNGTDASLTITPESIVLTDEVSYRYELDPEAKTIAFSFSRLTGDGHYRFSLDRQSLAIVDGSFTWSDTLAADFGWTVEALLASARGESLPPASGKNVTLLTRASASERAAEDAARQAAVSVEGDGALGDKVEAAGADATPADGAGADGAAPADGAGADGAAPADDAAGSGAGGASAAGSDAAGGAASGDDTGGAAPGDGTGAGGAGSEADGEPVYDPDKPLEPGGNAVDAADPS